jgi:hypothetical protein
MIVMSSGDAKMGDMIIGDSKAEPAHIQFTTGLRGEAPKTPTFIVPRFITR